MKYTVDSISEGIVKLVSLSDNGIKYENIHNVPFEINESDVLIFDNSSYVKDEKEKATKNSF